MFKNCSFFADIQEKMGYINDAKIYAAFPYDADREDELSFASGEELLVLDRSSDALETNWWWCKHVTTGVDGYVPRNYFSLYPKLGAQRAVAALKEKQQAEVKIEIVKLFEHSMEPEEWIYLVHLFNDVVAKRYQEGGHGHRKVYSRLKQFISHTEKSEDLQLLSTLIQSIGNLRLEQGVYSLITIIDSDTPDLPKSIVQESFELLTSGRTEAVFGPCYDGGYYLVGLRKPHPELFRDIPWSTATVLQKTLATAKKNTVKTQLLQRRNDLDTIEDLLDYYHKHKDKPPEGAWTGEKTFRCLSRMERITGFNSSDA